MASCSRLQGLLDGSINIVNGDAKELKALQNSVFNELYNIAQDKEGKAQIINAFTDSFVSQLKEQETNILKSNKALDIAKDISKITSILSLNINDFNYYLKSYFSLTQDNAVETDEFPLLLQEEAIYQGVSFLTRDESIFNEIKANLKGKLDKLKESNNKEWGTIGDIIERINSKVFGVDAVAGSGKTKMIAKTTIKIAEKLGKGKKIIATSPIVQISKDIHDELNGVDNKLHEPIDIKTLYNKINNGEISLDDVDTLLIDEATLIDSNKLDIYNPKTNRYESQEENGKISSFSLLYNLIQSKNNKIKLLLLGDSNQMGFSEGEKGVLIEDAKFGARSIFMSPILRSEPITQSFRTSSILLKDVYRQMLDSKVSLYSNENPLKSKYAVSVEDPTLLLGLKVNKGSINKEGDIRKQRIDIIKKALKEKISGNNTVLSSIKKQASKKKKKPFSLIIATDLKISKDELIAELSKDREIADIFNLSKRTDNTSNNEDSYNLEIKVFTNKLSNVQGSEADYIIAEFSDEANAEGIISFKEELGTILTDKTQLNSNPSIRKAKETLYTLATRGRMFVNMINNTSVIHMDSTFDAGRYDLVKPEMLLTDANKAKFMYKEIFDNTDFGRDDEINWNDNTAEVETKPISKNIEEAVEIIDKTKNKIITDKDVILDAMNVIYLNNTESIGTYIKEQEDLIKELKDNPLLPIEDVKIIQKRVNELDNIIKIKRFIDKQLKDGQTENFIFNKLSKVSIDINEAIKDLKGEKRARAVASLFNEKGYAYTYMQDEKYEDENERALAETDLLKDLLDNDINVNTSFDHKYEQLGLVKNKSGSLSNGLRFFVKRFIDDNGKHTYRLYIVSESLKKNSKIKEYSLLMTNNISLWTGEEGLKFKQLITDLFKDTEKDIIEASYSKDRINDFVSAITPGRIVKSKSNVKTNFKDFKDKLGKETINGKPKINFSEVYTMMNSQSKFAGRQFVFYSHSDFVDFKHQNFDEWVEESISKNYEEDTDLSTVSGLYKDVNGLEHQVGIIVLENKNYSLQEMADITSNESSLKERNEITNFLLTAGTTDSSLKTLAYIYLKNKGINNPLKSIEEAKLSNKTLTSIEVQDDENKLKNNSELKRIYDYLNEEYYYTSNKFKQNEHISKVFGEDVSTKIEIDKKLTDLFYQNKEKYGSMKDSEKSLFDIINHIFENVGSFERTDNGNLVPLRNDSNIEFAKVKHGSFITLAIPNENETYSSNFTDRQKTEKVNRIVHFKMNEFIRSIYNSYKIDIDGDISLNEKGVMVLNDLDTLFKTNKVTSKGFKIYPHLELEGKDSNDFKNDTAKISTKFDNNDNENQMLVNLDDINEPNIIVNIEELNNTIFKEKVTKKTTTDQQVDIDIENKISIEKTLINKSTELSNGNIKLLANTESASSMIIDVNEFVNNLFIDNEDISKEQYQLILDSIINNDTDALLTHTTSIIIDNMDEVDVEDFYDLEGEGKDLNELVKSNLKSYLSGLEVDEFYDDIFDIIKC